MCGLGRAPRKTDGSDSTVVVAGNAQGWYRAEMRLRAKDGAGPRASDPAPPPAAALVFLGYVVAFGVLAAPLLADLRAALPTQPNLDDSRVLPWVLSWVTHALTTSPATLFDANVSHPAPAQLTGVPHLFASQLVVAPLRWMGVGPIAAANAVAFLTYPLAGLAMQRLLVRLGVPLAVSLVGGLWFALGSFRVPYNLNQLQFANLFLPWLALALTRLREEPGMRRAAHLVLAFGIGAFSSFYCAVLLGVTGALWGLFELARPAPGRARFVAWSLGGVAVVGLLLLVVATPYAARLGDHVDPQALAMPWRAPSFLPGWLWAVVTLSPRSIGVVPRSPVLLVLALAGAVFAWLGWRRGVPVARRLFPVAATLYGTGAILAWGYPPLLHTIAAATPLGMVRYLPRYLLVADFGLTILLAVGVCAAGARFGEVWTRRTAIAVGVLLVAIRGPAFADVPLRSVPAYADARGVYDRAAAIWRDEGKGALLELPIFGREPGEKKPRTLEPDAILATTLHWWPTPAAHVSYHPPHRWLFMRTVEALPEPWALEELVDLTAVRWILARPASYWVDEARRTAVLALLRDGPVETESWSLGSDWQLFRLDRTPSRPAWLDAVRSGDVRGRTILGTPLTPLAPDQATGIVRVGPRAPTGPLRGRIGNLWLEVTNTGPRTWPVAVASTIPITLDGRWGTVRPLDDTVTVVARWHPTHGEPPAADVLPAPQRKRLRRDVAPGETIRQPLDLFLPKERGWYDLEVTLDQVGGADFTAPGNEPARLRVFVEPGA